MTLTQIAIWTKRILYGSGILIVLSIISWISLVVWRNYQVAKIPPKIEKPEMKFGALPNLVFPPISVSSSNFSYSINTTTGSLPEFPKFTRVYFIPQSGISLLSSQKSQDLANNLGFLNGPENLSTTQQRFTDSSNNALTIELTTGNFSFNRVVATDSADLDSTLLSDQGKTIQDFKNFLASKNLLPKELSEGRGSLVFNEASRSATTSAVVSVWPGDFDGIPIISGFSQFGLVTANLTSPDKNGNKYSSLNYTYWPIDQTTSSTYPTKTADQAFKELQQGGGYITLSPKAAQVSIARVTLSYYQSKQYAPYLQPVFVFEGPSFQALVPAIIRL